jgi:hypothetical protein
VALAAKSSLGQLAHIHLIGALRHLEHLIVAARTLQPPALHMELMAEDHRSRPLGPERKIAASNNLSPRVYGQHHAEHKTYRQYLFHSPPPLKNRFKLHELSVSISEFHSISIALKAIAQYCTYGTLARSFLMSGDGRLPVKCRPLIMALTLFFATVSAMTSTMIIIVVMFSVLFQRHAP